MDNSYLTQDESDDGHGSAEKRGQHEKFETVDDSFVKLPPVGSHGRQSLSFGADVAENTIDDERQEQEIDSCRYSGKNDKAQLSNYMKTYQYVN